MRRPLVAGGRWVVTLAAAFAVAASGCGDDTGGHGGAGAAGGGDGAPATSTGAGGNSAGTTASTTSASAGGGDGGAPGAGGGGGDAVGGDGGAGQGGAGQGGAGGAGGGSAADGYGAIAGACGDVDLRDVLDPQPALLENAIDFTGEPPITIDDTSALTEGGQAIAAEGNLGGSSLWSEVFAFEVLARCDGAELVKTEAEIVYDVEGKKTDILVAIDGERVGVSVVRAVGFPPEDPYTVDDALPILEGKLDDILVSSANVAPEDAWEKQILSVIAYSNEHAASITEAWELLDDATRADTIVLVTVTHGDDDFVYFGD